MGGRFRIAAIPPKRGEINEFVDYLIRSVRSSGVKIETGVSIKPEDLAALGDFEEVVIAVGGVPISLPLPETPSHIPFAEDVLQKKITLGSKIVVLGGGMVGCETAEWLAEQGKQVTIIEKLPEIAGDMEVRTRKMMLARLDSHRVEIICQTIVESLGKGSVICRQGGLRFEIGGVDNLVLSLGYKANSLNLQLPSKRIHRIGDCVHPRRAIEAVHEGFFLGVEL